MAEIANQANKQYKIYMVGICGIAMGTLAAMLQESGHEVIGSDQDIYPPMSEMLNKWGIKTYKGFNANQIKNIDFVIIGNAMSRGNEEVEYILNNKIPYMSMTDALYKFFLQDKTVIAVCGTHGKTTTTSLLAHILDYSKNNVSFFVGGVLKNYNSNYKICTGEYFIVEGDEYDSAFFDKTPKFIHYKPNHVILTSLEFDHADIYKNLNEISTWFKRLVNIIPANGNVIYNTEYESINEVVENSFSKNIQYGKSTKDYSYNFETYENEYSIINVKFDSEKNLKLKTFLMGDFNYSNICAAVSMAIELGVNTTDIKEAVKTFRGVTRRQELLYSSENIKIYEDFAHHPTSIKAMINAVNKQYPGCKIWALYEPRSATSRRNIFQEELPGSFENASYVMIKNPYKLDKIPEHERIDLNEVISNISKSVIKADVYNDVNSMVKHIEETIDTNEKNIIVIMSNGGFDGIYDLLVERVREL